MNKFTDWDVYKKIVARNEIAQVVDVPANQFRNSAVGYSAVNALIILESKSPLLMNDMDKNVPAHLREEALQHLVDLGFIKKTVWKKKTAWSLI